MSTGVILLIAESLGVFILSFIALIALIRVVNIALALSTLFSALPFLRRERAREKKRIQREQLWPEIIEILIAGIESGLTLGESLVSLAMRGPASTQDFFERMKKKLQSGAPLSVVLTDVKNEFRSSVSDQVCEVLSVSQRAGSRDTSLILRTLSTFISDELLQRNEIRAKLSWIQNSATLAAIAPWLLLLVLCTQRSTRLAYSTASGGAILFLGIALTFLAYIWMRNLGKFNQVPRVFPL